MINYLSSVLSAIIKNHFYLYREFEKMGKRLRDCSRQYRHKLIKKSYLSSIKNANNSVVANNASSPIKDSHNSNREFCDMWELPAEVENINYKTARSEEGPQEANEDANANTETYIKNNFTKMEDLKTELRLWALRHNINLSAMNDLLHLLAKFGLSLPLDSRTLLHTPREVSVFSNVSPGEYFHNGILTPIKRRLEILNFKPNDFQEINFLINIDGLPISKSTTDCLWPIQIKIPELSNFIYFAGIYYGIQKPKSFNVFLAQFTEEMQGILENGILFQEKVIPVKIKGFVCDAPAKAEIAYIKPFNAYYGCPICIVEGKFKRILVFNELSERLRTNESFRLCHQIEHHKEEHSILGKLPVDMVEGFLLDSMHVIYLGVTKK